MKKTITALMALAGVAMADTITFDLSALNAPNTLIGGDSSNALTTTAAFDNTTSYTALTGLLTESNKWYASAGYNNNINTSTGNGVPSSDTGVVLVAGGPSGSGRSTIGAIEFSLTVAEIAQVDGPLTFSFNAAHQYGNDNNNHEFTFILMSESVTLTSAVYNSKTGSNLLEEGAATPLTIELAFTAEQVDAMKATNADQTFAFVAYSNAVNGSNTGVLMNNFTMSGQLVPEPTTATLSLLALAGLAARRRRK